MNIFLLIFFYLLLVITILAILYFLVDYILSSIPIHSSRKNGLPKNIQIYVMSNGVHTDIVLPVTNPQQDWARVFPFENTCGNGRDYRYMAVGWGDKGFFLNTPQWKDLTFKTAFVAAFGLGEAALHVTYYQQIQPNDLCYGLLIDMNQYDSLKTQILSWLVKDSLNEQSVLITTQAQYGQTDAFYEAKGCYHAFFSCNTWTNRVLKNAGMPSGLWTVFDRGILKHYRK